MNRLRCCVLLIVLAVVARAQTQFTLSNGVTYKSPEGWRSVEVEGGVKWTAPEGDLNVWVLAVDGANATEAVAGAWRRVNAGMGWKVLTQNEGVGRNGWESTLSVGYDAPANEKRAVQALLLRGKTAVVVLIDGDMGTAEKRSSQMNLLIGSLRQAGEKTESFAGRKASKLTPERIAELKEFLLSGMKLADVPGVGVAVIEGGKVVYEAGLGVKDVNTKAAVDANTLFMAASNTKGMTTLLLAMLADQKKLAWNQQVKSLFPAFQLGDAEITKQVQVRHLVCACTGMPRQDYDWIFEYQGQTAQSSMEMLGAMRPTSKFGEVFQYSNLMVSAAGYAAAHLVSPGKEMGAAYDAAMEQYVFGPLGMKSTTFSMSKALAGNYAKPHAENLNGEMVVVPMDLNYAVVPHRPAGGVWTSAHDLARYVLNELNKGVLDGKRVVSEANLLERRKPQIAVGEDIFYAMGLSVSKSNGIEVVSHGGSLFGYKSDLRFLPEYGVGAVILTNSDNGPMLIGPFLRKFQEVLFDGRPEARKSLELAVQNSKKGLAKFKEIYTVPAEAGSAAGLTGKYQNAALGTLVVSREGGDLVFDFGEWKSPMASRKNADGTVGFAVTRPELLGFEFVRGGTKEEPTIVTRDAQHEYVFARVK